MKVTKPLTVSLQFFEKSINNSFKIGPYLPKRSTDIYNWWLKWKLLKIEFIFWGHFWWNDSFHCVSLTNIVKNKSVVLIGLLEKFLQCGNSLLLGNSWLGSVIQGVRRQKFSEGAAFSNDDVTMMSWWRHKGGFSPKSGGLKPPQPPRQRTPWFNLWVAKILINYR